MLKFNERNGEELEMTKWFDEISKITFWDGLMGYWLRQTMASIAAAISRSITDGVGVSHLIEHKNEGNIGFEILVEIR